MTILLIRPKSKIEASCNKFKSAGLNTVGMALIDTAIDELELKKLNTLLEKGQVEIAIFVSTNAAQACSSLRENWHQGIRCFAVGSSTQKCLEENGIRAQTPVRHDSEGLLELLNKETVSDKDILLVKGHGGRELLTNELRSRGANVLEAPVYKRIELEQPFFTRDWQPEEIACIIVTSAEQVNAAYQQFDHHWLNNLTWGVVSERVAEVARAYGATQVLICNGADDQSLIEFARNKLEQ